MTVTGTVWSISPPRVRRLLQAGNRTRPGNRPRWGNLRRPAPFSDCYGYDRGTPVDRWYIEHFLETHRARVRGRALEVRSAEYTHRYGGAAVEESVVIDIDPANADATIHGDLCDPDVLAPGSLDCVVLTQTLHLIARPDRALANVWAALAPQGALLVTGPCVSRTDPEASVDYWRWAPQGFRMFLEQHCVGVRTLDVVGFGSALTTLAFTLGLVAEELSERELLLRDERFPLVCCAVAVK